MTKSRGFVVLLFSAWFFLALVPMLQQVTMPVWMRLALGVSGGFSLLLGLVHFFLPSLLGYKEPILRNQAPSKTFHFGPIKYSVQRQDLLGIVWVMNHHASYGLVSIGLLDLGAADWLTSHSGRWAALWIAGWWWLRSANQFYLGRRLGDWVISAGFFILGLVHVAVWYHRE